jgi:hypothetical protein
VNTKQKENNKMKTQPQFPTVQEQINYWNTKERLEHERVMNIRAESPNERNETRVAKLEAAMQNVLFVARGAADENNLCSICWIAQEALGLSHGQAATTAKTLTQEDEAEREEATTDWFDSIADQEESRYRLRDEGTIDGEGESYAARNL